MLRHNLLACCLVAFFSAAITWYLVDPQAYVLYKHKLNLQRLLLSIDGGSTGSLNAASTTFVFYKLSLQWPPAACSSEPPPDKPIFICKGPIPDNFTIHGLWPQGKNDTPIPPYNKNNSCVTGVRPIPESELIPRLQKHGFVQELLKVWPNLKNTRNMRANEFFWKAEWGKHGMCSDYADRPLDYFNSTVNLLKGLNVLKLLKRGRNYTVEELAKIIKPQIQNKKPEIHCTKDRNKEGQALLTEVRICYDKAMPPITPQDCKNDSSGPCGNKKNKILFK